MNDKQIKHMVDRFLAWKLPNDFYPDAGITFERTYNDGRATHEPVGTNLFSATQAEAMIRNMLKELPEISLDVEVLRAQRYRVDDEDVQAAWDSIREELLDPDYQGGSLPRDIFENVVSEIEAGYHHLLGDAADRIEELEWEKCNE